MDLLKSDRKIIRSLKILLMAAAFCLLLFILMPQAAKADQLTPNFESTDGSKGENILDDSNFTTEPFEAGTVITLSSDSDIGYLYVKWDRAPGEWQLSADDKDMTCGKDGFLHELVELSGPAKSLDITIPNGGATLVDLYIYSPGDLPDDVQVWQPSCEEADVLLISTHADDEVLFFGGIIPNYTNKDKVRVQVAYFTEHYSTGENMRMHEALDGLWTMGVTHYPQFGEFEDLYSESLEEAEAQYDVEAGREYIVRTIRRFKPQVVIGQDLNGEYGHGCHMLTAKLISEAITITNDESEYSESAKQYGTWKVPKTYLHLYPERGIELDARAPLEKFGGKTALEVAKAAYLDHESQQWTWFYVSDGYDENGNPDGYQYSCTKYGLYATEVGDDISMNDILENIVLYDDQSPADQSPAEYETNEEGETVTDEDGNPVTVDKAEPLTDENGETIVEEKTTADAAADPGNRTGSGSAGKVILVIVIVIAIIAVIFFILMVWANHKKKQRRRQRVRQVGQTRDPERYPSGTPARGNHSTGRSRTSADNTNRGVREYGGSSRDYRRNSQSRNTGSPSRGTQRSSQNRSGSGQNRSTDRTPSGRQPRR